jgi:5,10-methylenetetrahydromethanopterin reductase
VNVGVVLGPRESASEIAELARLAEARGLSHIWLSGGARTKDHFVRLAVAAAATRRIRLGPVALSPFEMHPAQIALALLTLEELAPGRACAVLGAGGDLAATLGLPPRGRVDAVEECIDIVRLLAAGGEVDYTGFGSTASSRRGAACRWTVSISPPIVRGCSGSPRARPMA